MRATRGFEGMRSAAIGRMAEEFRIFAGSANPALAADIAGQLGIQLGAASVERFPDSEVSVCLLEPVRRKEVYLVQPTAPRVDEHLMELLAFADACRRAAARHVTAIVPYFGYARHDRRHARRQPITASMVAGLMQAVGINHVIAVDLHTPQIEGFFHVPVDSLTAVPTLAAAVHRRLPPNVVVVSPDAGRIPMATQFAQQLNAPLVVMHKRRKSSTETVVTHVVGDVGGHPCLLVDDMISTGTTIAESVDALLSAGASPDITVAATHGLLLDGAREKLGRPEIREVVITDTVSVTERVWPGVRVVSVAPLIAVTIERFLADGSLSDLF